MQQTAELGDYKDRVQKLQNQLIRVRLFINIIEKWDFASFFQWHVWKSNTITLQKNDREKEYLKLSHAHQSQQDLVQKLQDKAAKVRRLEEACKKQEKVIEKMERLINNGGKVKSRKFYFAIDL